MCKLKASVCYGIITFLLLYSLPVFASNMTEKEKVFMYLDTAINYIIDTYCGDISEQKLVENAVLEVIKYSNSDESYDAVSKKDKIYLEDTITKVINKYDGKYTYKDLVGISIKGMINNLDNYTCFYNGFNSVFEPDIEKQLGINIEEKDNYIVINKVIPESNAHLSNIEVGDKIIKIDGINVEGKNIKEVENLINNNPNDKVSLSVLKNLGDKIKVIELSKISTEKDAVVYDCYNDIGYIKINIFNSTGNGVISEALNDFKLKGISKVILDVRDNPGGEVENVIKIASKFVPKGLITKIDFKSKSTEDVNYSSDLSQSNYKLVVLVNGQSSSGAEILASAIQDAHSGVIIGTKTAGNSKIQSLIPLLTFDAFDKYYKEFGNIDLNAYELMTKYKIVPEEDEIFGWIRITTGEFYTPQNRNLNKEGVLPDIQVQDNKNVNDVNIDEIYKLQRKQKLVLNDISVDVYRAEKILKAAGYDIDTPDCILDEKTVAAITQLQIDCGGFGYGELDLTTQQWLNDKLDKIILEYDAQFKKAIETLDKE